jgi:hypothetical protein
MALDEAGLGTPIARRRVLAETRKRARPHSGRVRSISTPVRPLRTRNRNIVYACLCLFADRAGGHTRPPSLRLGRRYIGHLLGTTEIRREIA